MSHEEDISAAYYFESDHVSLKENSDYRKVVHTIAILEAQRQQAAKDIETLYKVQDKALSDPISFVENLQQGRKMGFPQPQQIVSLPEIEWSKYTSNANFSSFGSARHMTRYKKNTPDASSNNSDSDSNNNANNLIHDYSKCVHVNIIIIYYLHTLGRIY